MPTFSNAEAKIKKLVIYAFWVGMTLTALRFQINEIIKQVKKDIPSDLHDKDAYINGLILSSNKLIADQQKATRLFNKTKKYLVDKNGEVLHVKTPDELKKALSKMTPSEKRNMWAEAKGVPTPENYDRQIKQFIKKVSDRPFVTHETGKKPISLWQKAELDVRYDKQMEMLTELLDQNVEYAWISSHPDCSKRCEKWQGKLVSLTKHATMSGFRVGKLDGHWVYSLPDIMAQVDKYGYHNNIICGFNCRHKLHKYTPNSSAPKSYTKEEVKQQRAIELKIRQMERNIRLLKMKYNDFIIIDDKKSAKELKKEINVAVANYKAYCEKNGYSWEKYRIDVNDNNIYLARK